jgi:hypothetical protein
MPNYMLLLYSRERPRRTGHDRDAERLLLAEAAERLSATGMLVSADTLCGAGTAATVRVRAGTVERADGPSAVTEEALRGCFVVDCRDVEEALAVAADLPTAAYGSVEVRPIVDPREHWDRTAFDRLWQR